MRIFHFTRVRPSLYERNDPHHKENWKNFFKAVENKALEVWKRKLYICYSRLPILEE